MAFNSYEFLLFFPLVVALYFFVPKKIQWLVLLSASYFFYGFVEPFFVIILFYSTIVDYWAGHKIYHSPNKSRKKLWLLFSLLNNFVFLFYFKYLDFFRGYFIGETEALRTIEGINDVNILIPIGISFYTLQTISYTVDIYRGYLKPVTHFGHFALFVSFFPQLVAGPIEKAKNILPQLNQSYSFDYFRVVEGLRLMLWGFFKKLVIADRIGMYVDSVYGQADLYAGFPCVLASVLFIFQVFLDFSAYTDIATGAARIFGIKLSKNFTHRPYAVSSIRQFWQEYHITLTTWFRSYMYLPLSKLVRNKTFGFLALFLTFVATGLWHGANWTFVIWGALHGLLLVIDYVTLDKRIKFINHWNLKGIVKWIAPPLLLIIVLPTAVFFRSKDLDSAYSMISNFSLSNIESITAGIDKTDFILIFVFLITYDLFTRVFSTTEFHLYLNSKAQLVRWSTYFVLLLCIVQFGVFYTDKFIYFQF